MTSTLNSAPRDSYRDVGPPGRSRVGRRERYAEGRVPLHTLRADIDYGLARPRRRTRDRCECWIFKGDIADKELRQGSLTQRVQDDVVR